MKIYERGKLSFDLEVETDVRDDEALKLKQAVRHSSQALSSDLFKQFCLNYEYSYRSCRGALWWKRCQTNRVQDFNWNSGLTREQIYNKIMTGSETLSPEVDGTADIILRVDRRNKRGVLGYTYPNSTRQWIYANFLAEASYKDVAGNLAHEWAHKLGFGHAFKYHYTRQFTIPYAVGYFVRDYIHMVDNEIS